MSQDLQLEEGTAGQAPGASDDNEDLFSLAPDSLIGSILYWFVVMVIGIIVLIAFVIVQVLKFVSMILIKHVIKELIKFAIKKKNFLLLCVIAIILDPLFFYIPVMNNEKKCIELDKKLGITATVLRSIFDLLKAIHIIYVLLTEFRENRKRDSWVSLLIIDVLDILPAPQVLVSSKKIRGTKFLSQMSGFFVVQYFLRVIRTYMLFTQATGVTGILAEATWAIVAFNLLLFMHGGHAFGALWYFFAIAKAVGCWNKACINHIGCSRNSFSCDDNLGDNKFLNDMCDIKAGNTTFYDFGLFNDALQSGIVERTYFSTKLLYCLQWGLQNLSAFGQSLRTSTNIWENIFAICMTSFGVVLFVFLIGEMQSDTARSQKIRKKWEEIKQWANFTEISSDIQGQLRKYKREKWQETKRVDVGNLMNDLPEDLGNKIKRKLSLKLLKNVKEFKNMSEKSLGDLCDCLKPVFFTERTRIVQEGDPIDEMLFVLKGKLWTYTSRNQIKMLIDLRRRENHLKDGDFFGQELIAWAKNQRLPNLPISTRTIQALTNVEAFTLMADDLKHVLLLSHLDQAALLLQSYWRFRRFLRARRTAGRRSRLRSLRDMYLERILSALQ